MNTDRSCGCKSFRSCYICEKELGIVSKEAAKEKAKSFSTSFTYHPKKNLLIDDESKNEIPFFGIQILENFISEEEEAKLISDLDQLPWDMSQSGRRKQNFGPKANFKKRKVKAGDFRGFPSCTKFVQDRFDTVPSLEGYRTVEQCSIEYRPETGACIDPHTDDCWVWGERIVQLNLLSDSFLTCFPYKPDPSEKIKYNIDDIKNFPRILDDSGKVIFNPFRESHLNRRDIYERKSDILDSMVRIPLPRRSLLVFYGEPRYDWEHCIMRDDISDRRIVIAYREFTPTYLPGGSQEVLGKEILDRAKMFWEE